jgi:non-heme chloroperoxidase
VPAVVSESAFKRQEKNSEVTRYQEMPGRGHSLAMDHGWQEVAEAALTFVNQYAPAFQK